MPGKHLVLRGDARRIPLAAGSVDLIVTSPPYWAQRSYRDAGGHYDGQIGSEYHPRRWLEAMYEVMKECWRVLAPGGSVFVNLGDKRAGSGGHNNSGVSKSKGSGSGLSGGPQYSHKPLAREGGPTGATSILAGRSHTAERDATRATRRNAPDRYEQAHFGRRKSRQLLPERFAIGCEDGLADPDGIGWIVRQIIVWQKANGLPESVTDRTRDDFEYILHLTKSERYFAAMDEIREQYSDDRQAIMGRSWEDRKVSGERSGNREPGSFTLTGNVGAIGQANPLGKVPGSVWRIASEPLRIPDWAKEKYNLPDHFAAFPTEIPRRLILGFSPSGICTACNEPRRPVVEKRLQVRNRNVAPQRYAETPPDGDMPAVWSANTEFQGSTEATITGYACRCPDTSAPTRNAVILDVFGGTGTTALVAETLGRTGISLDLSADYCNLARWRIEESHHGRKAEQRTWAEAQGTML